MAANFMRQLLYSLLPFACACSAGSAAEPAPDIFLLEATIECGWGERYSVPKGRFSQPELRALATLLHFRFSGRDVFPIQFEQRTPTPISIHQMEQLLSDSAFRMLIGPLVDRRARALAKERVRLEESREILPRDPERFLQHPRVRAYEEAGTRLIDAL